MPHDPPKKGWLAAFIDRRLTAPADASRVALKGLPQNSYPTIGPAAVRNGKPVSLAIKPDAYGDMRDIVTEGNGLLDILPGVGEIRGLAQGKQLADEGHPLLGAALGAVSALPLGGAAVKKLSKKATAQILERAAAGGFTFDPRLGSFVEHGGVMVGGVPGQKGMAVAAGDDVAKALEKFRASNAELLSQDGMMMGGWFDKDSNKFFFDVSQRVPREEAPALLKARGEKAGWDLDAGEELVNPHATEAVSAGNVGTSDYVPTPDEALDALAQRIRDENPGLEQFEPFIASTGEIKLGNIKVKADARSQGTGTKAMRALLKYADEQGVPVALDPRPDKGKRAALESFYRELGFRPASSSRNYNPGSSGEWWRPPRPPAEPQGLLAPEPPEKIKAAAVRVGDNIMQGATHGHAMDLASVHPWWPGGNGWDSPSVEQGFMTTRGRFVNRQDAIKVAEAERAATSGPTSIDVDQAKLHGYAASEDLDPRALLAPEPKAGPGDLGPDGKYTMPMSEAAAGRSDPIVAAAVRSPASGKVYQGLVHADAIDQIKEAEGQHVADAVAKSNSWHDLFVTRSGATINRRALADEWGGRRPVAELMQLPPQAEPAAMTPPETKPEKVVSAAVRDPQGRVAQAPFHSLAHEMLGIEGGTEGFVTNSGRFVSREEARQIAQAAGQTREEVNRAAQKSLFAPQVLTTPEGGNTIPLDVSINPEGVDASRPELYRPGRADLSVLEPVKRRIRDVYTPAAERGLREGGIGPAWYDLSPLKKIFEQESPSGAEDFKMFTALMGPTSAGTDVPMNIRQASLFYKLWKEGKLTPEALAAKSLEIPPGYGNRLNIRGPLARVVEHGHLDPLATPKTFRYSEQLGGGSWGGTALDRHVGYNVGLLGEHTGSEINAGVGRGFPTGGYATTKEVSTSPQNTHYAAIEDAMVREAEKLGVHPAVYQAAGWVGNAGKTGVTDARHPLEIINAKLGETAKRFGHKSRTAALRAFIRGETPLWALGGLGAYGLLSQDEQPAGGLLGEQ